MDGDIQYPSLSVADWKASRMDTPDRAPALTELSGQQESERHAMLAQLETLGAVLAATQDKLDRSQRRLRALRNSISWKVTSPLREVRRAAVRVSRLAGLALPSASQSPPRMKGVVSQLCTQAQIDSSEYGYWCERFHNTRRYHRKQWEFCYILQALLEAGMLSPGKRGLGFGVGREPLAAVIANRGCTVVATDMDTEAAAAKGWTADNQHAANLASLNEQGICDPDRFAARVTFRGVDMNRIPADLADFDFIWSSCALEHLGSLEHGLRFVHHSLDCLKPGGVAVHTTEFNLFSDDRTIESANLSIYRRSDIERLARELRRQGHQIELNLTIGSGPIDKLVGEPPYTQDPNLRLNLGGFICTSLGLLIRKRSRPGALASLWSRRSHR
jgi:2-polyprenyl-3-methyl-5-hydroxy-6-metoxy-1,4-benzoquinol methylase